MIVKSVINLKKSYFEMYIFYYFMIKGMTVLTYIFYCMFQHSVKSSKFDMFSILANKAEIFFCLHAQTAKQSEIQLVP